MRALKMRKVAVKSGKPLIYVRIGDCTRSGSRATRSRRA